MATIIPVERVKYKTNDGSKNPLCYLYFCRYCLNLKSSDMVYHEIDHLYCPSCLHPSYQREGFAKKNRCEQCWQCPFCSHTLSVRASSVLVPDEQDPQKTVPKKMYYLSCSNCRWTTRDVTIPDQLTGTFVSTPLVDPNVKRIEEIIDYFKYLAKHEKQEIDRKRATTRRKSYFGIPDKFGLLSKVQRRLSRTTLSATNLISQSSFDFNEAEATENVEALPESFYSQPLEISQVATMAQRLADPELQPVLSAELRPLALQFRPRFSRRCRQCQHNVIKPECSVSVTKFRIQMCALLHVPEVRLLEQPNLLAGQYCPVILTLTNLSAQEFHVLLSPLTPSDPEISAEVVVPQEDFLIPPEHMTMMDGSGNGDLAPVQPGSVGVLFRRENKVGIAVLVKPSVDKGDIIGSFLLKHDYVSTTLSSSKAEGQEEEQKVSWLEHPVVVNFGRLGESSC